MWPTVLEAREAFTGIDRDKFDDILAFVSQSSDWQPEHTIPPDVAIKLMVMDWLYRLNLLTVESRYTAITKLAPHLEGISRCVPDRLEDLKQSKLIAMSVVDGYKIQIPRYSNSPPGDLPVVVYDLKNRRWIEKHESRPCTIISCDLIAMLHRLCTSIHSRRNGAETRDGQ